MKSISMRILVEILTGTLFYVEVADDAKVSDLKREIEAQRKLPFDRLILFLNSDRTHLIREAEDGVSLVDIGVEDDAHFYLFFKPLDQVVIDNVHDGGGGGSCGGDRGDSTNQPLLVSSPATPIGVGQSEDE